MVIAKWAEQCLDDTLYCFFFSRSFSFVDKMNLDGFLSSFFVLYVFSLSITGRQDADFSFVLGGSKQTKIAVRVS